MTTKKELINRALSHIKDFDSITELEVTIHLVDGLTMRCSRPMYRGKKYTKEEWCFKAVNSCLRNNPYDDTRPSIGQPDLDIKNIKSVKVIAKH